MILCVFTLDISGTIIFAYPYQFRLIQKEIFTLAFLYIFFLYTSVLSFAFSFALSCRVYLCL